MCSPEHQNNVRPWPFVTEGKCTIAKSAVVREAKHFYMYVTVLPGKDQLEFRRFQQEPHSPGILVFRNIAQSKAQIAQGWIDVRKGIAQYLVFRLKFEHPSISQPCSGSSNATFRCDMTPSMLSTWFLQEGFCRLNGWRPRSLNAS